MQRFFKSPQTCGPQTSEQTRIIMVKEINKSFIYGVSVSGDNFTDRIKETRRLKMNFENGLNVVLISPRRMGKTSLVKKVQKEVDSTLIHTVYMDIYDCRSEYDFYNKFAESILKQTSGKMEIFLEKTKKFLTRLTPKISFSPDPNADFSVSLGITPEEYTAEEILQLPELIAQQMGKHIVICIDEFKGNLSGNKYQAIMVNPVTKRITNIYPTRYKKDLAEEFAKIDKQKRFKVKFFICDM